MRSAATTFEQLNAASVTTPKAKKGHLNREPVYSVAAPQSPISEKLELRRKRDE
jgi:hypothetical protein